MRKDNKADATDKNQGAVAHRAYLGLGSSLGNRASQLKAALARLHSAAQGVTVQAVSPVYETPHLGLAPGDETRFPPHYNCVAQVSTSLSAGELLARIQEIEAEGQRQRDTRWGPRTIDIDILLYDDLKIHTDALTVPHPGLTTRIFVARPLLDIAPDLVLPDGRRLRDVVEQGFDQGDEQRRENGGMATALSAQAIRRVEPDELLI